ncbi:MAG: hypothetical protein ACPHAP_02800, partial [Candidatus Puniceispirillaceae bacterium]
ASRDVAATLVERLRTAIAVRKSLRLPRTDTNAYRLVNGEGDRMSGIVIDVYDKLLVVSSSARWVELYKEQVIAAVSCHFADDYEVVWRLSKDRLRQDGWTPGTAEDLPPDSFAEATSEASQGASEDSQNTPALEEEMVVQEFGVKFAVSPRVGQKTVHQEQRWIRRITPSEVVNITPVRVYPALFTRHLQCIDEPLRCIGCIWRQFAVEVTDIGYRVLHSVVFVLEVYSYERNWLLVAYCSRVFHSYPISDSALASRYRWLAENAGRKLKKRAGNLDSGAAF